MTRLERLEEIADLAFAIRSLERELIHAKNPRSTMDRLQQARLMLDEALAELKALDRS